MAGFTPAGTTLMTTTSPGCPATCPHRQQVEGIPKLLIIFAEWATMTKQSAKLKNLRQTASRRLARLLSKPCPFADDADHKHFDQPLPPKAIHAN